MIIQIKGTSGSGKSTGMVKFKDHVGGFEPRYLKGRKMPLWYVRSNPKGKDTVILSHYESPCAGCDVFGSARIVYEVIEMFDLSKYDLVFEGLMLSEDTKWALQMEKLLPKETHNIFLKTSIETCIDRIKKRRIEKGNTKPLDEANTRRRYEVINRARIKLDNEGINTYYVSGKRVPSLISKLLGIK